LSIHAWVPIKFDSTIFYKLLGQTSPICNFCALEVKAIGQGQKQTKYAPKRPRHMHQWLLVEFLNSPIALDQLIKHSVFYKSMLAL